MSKVIRQEMEKRNPTGFMRPSKPKCMRICSACGYRDNTPIPPIMCPQCHFQEDSPLARGGVKMNRRERRAAEARNRVQQRKAQKQIDREGPVTAS